jgi:hypothetical protein
MQSAILKAGWRFCEQTFTDGTVMIEFTKDSGNQVFSKFPRPADSLGWGRFQRDHAWMMAYDRIINGISTKQLQLSSTTASDSWTLTANLA